MDASRPVTRTFTADKSGLRLDQFLAGQPTGLTRSQLQRLIGDGLALLNGSGSKASSKVRRGDRVTLTVPPPKPTEVVPQWMPLTVVYQDEHIAVVDKPAGLAVHPGPGHSDHTLVNALLAICPDIQGVGGEIRPGIVHRLDKDTSGLMVVAKTHQAHQDISDQIKARRVDKGYLALAVGRVEPEVGVIDEPIGRDPHHRKRMAVVDGGRESRTKYRSMSCRPAGSECHPARARRRPGVSAPATACWKLVLETGRTHQIRVHLSYIGHPLVGRRRLRAVKPFAGTAVPSCEPAGVPASGDGRGCGIPVRIAAGVGGDPTGSVIVDRWNRVRSCELVEPSYGRL